MKRCGCLACACSSTVATQPAKQVYCYYKRDSELLGTQDACTLQAVQSAANTLDGVSYHNALHGSLIGGSHIIIWTD